MEGAGAGAAPSWLVRASLAGTLLLAAAPWWLLAAYYLLAVCGAALLCVGALLWAQLGGVAAGETYVDRLQRRRREAAEWAGAAAAASGGDGGSSGNDADGLPPGLWPRLCAVMGGRNVLVWLLVPQLFGPPPPDCGDDGASGDVGAKKVA